MTSVMEKMRVLGQEVEDKKVVQANIAYIMANREDWMASFPNKWIVVDSENLQTTRDDLFEVMKVMDRRQELNSTIVFYYSNNYEPPIIVQLIDVATT